MAAPTLVSGLTDIETFDGSPTFTSIGGGAGASVSTDVVKQGSQSAGRKANSTGRYGFAATVTGVDFTVAGRLYWAWWNILYSPNLLDTRANGGVRMLLGTGGVTNYNEYYVGGNDFGPDGRPVVAGKWYRSVIDVNNVAASATGGSGATLTNIDRIGITVNYTSTPSGNLLHFYIDGAQYGSGFQFTGGTGGDPVAMTDVSTYTENSSRAWGISQFEKGAYFCNGTIIPGSGATTTTFTDTDQAIFFEQQNYYDGVTASSVLNDNSQTIAPAGSGSTNSITNTVIKASGDDKPALDFSDTNITLTFSGNSVSGAEFATFASGQTVSNNVFNLCGLVTHGGATISGCTFRDSTSSASVLSSNTSTITNSTFESDGSNHAIEISATGTFSLTGHTFTNYAATDGSTGNEVIYNDSGGSVTLNASGVTGTISVRNGSGASTTVVNSVTLDVHVQDVSTNNIQNAQVAVYDSSDDSELVNELTNASGNIVQASIGSNTDIYVRVRKSTTGSTRYVPVETTATLSQNTSLTITLRQDSVASA
jgi:hypothetical protein